MNRNLMIGIKSINPKIKLKLFILEVKWFNSTLLNAFILMFVVAILFFFHVLNLLKTRLYVGMLLFFFALANFIAQC